MTLIPEWRGANHDAYASMGLLFLRFAVGSMMLGGHGWAKLLHFGAKASTFPDPIGLGATPSLALVVFAEVFCSFAIILGLVTRFAAVPLVMTMLVAALVVHADDPWQKKEFAFLYLVPLVSLVFLGPGRFSLDAALGSRHMRRVSSRP